MVVVKGELDGNWNGREEEEEEVVCCSGFSSSFGRVLAFLNE